AWAARGRSAGRRRLRHDPARAHDGGGAATSPAGGGDGQPGARLGAARTGRATLPVHLRRFRPGGDRLRNRLHHHDRQYPGRAQDRRGPGGGRAGRPRAGGADVADRELPDTALADGRVEPRGGGRRICLTSGPSRVDGLTERDRALSRGARHLAQPGPDGRPQEDTMTPTGTLTDESLARVAQRPRWLALSTVARRKVGHIGGPLSVMDMLATLFFDTMRRDPAAPEDPDRDRFILSKGHNAIGLYAVMALRGYLPVIELDTFDQGDSRLQGHPDMLRL